MVLMMIFGFVILKRAMLFYHHSKYQRQQTRRKIICIIKRKMFLKYSREAGETVVSGTWKDVLAYFGI